MDKPNILLVLTDQMRSTAMGCAGVEKVHTPNLDRLASQGTRFTNAVSGQLQTRHGNMGEEAR